MGHRATRSCINQLMKTAPHLSPPQQSPQFPRLPGRSLMIIIARTADMC